MLPAIVSVPLRAGPDVDETVTFTAPLPEPLDPEVMVSQLDDDEDAQGHPLGEETPIEIGPPLEPIDCEVAGAKEYTQGIAMKSCSVCRAFS